MDGMQPSIMSCLLNLQGLATEMARCENLPAMRDGQTILQAILQSEERLSLRMDLAVAGVSSSLVAVEHNNISRLFNRESILPHAALYALRDQQNREIEGFPRTPHEIGQLTGAALDSIFEKVGITVGNEFVAEKQKRLRVLVGLKGTVA